MLRTLPFPDHLTTIPVHDQNDVYDLSLVDLANHPAVV